VTRRLILLTTGQLHCINHAPLVILTEISLCTCTCCRAWLEPMLAASAVLCFMHCI
jgi:hypothetical protein